MLTPESTESIKLLKSLAATLGLLLVVSNVLWFIAYNTATGPLAKPTPTTTPTATPTTTMTPYTATPAVKASPTATPVITPSPTL